MAITRTSFAICLLLSLATIATADYYSPPVYTAPVHKPTLPPPVYTPPAYKPTHPPPVYTAPVHKPTLPPPVYTPPTYKPTLPPPVYTPPEYKPTLSPPVYTKPTIPPPVYTPPVYKPTLPPPVYTTPPPVYEKSPAPYVPKPTYTPPVYKPTLPPPVYTTPPPVYEKSPTPYVPKPVYTPPVYKPTLPPPVYTTPPPVYEKSPTPYVPKPTYTPPTKPYVPEILKAVDGIILCKHGYESYPIQGAKAKIVCSEPGPYGHTKEVVTYSDPTDSKGYFYLPLTHIKDLLYCRVKLYTSPVETCKNPTNVNKGVTGIPLSMYGYRYYSAKNVNLYSVGPFYFTGPKAAPTPKY